MVIVTVVIIVLVVVIIIIIIIIIIDIIFITRWCTAENTILRTITQFLGTAYSKLDLFP